ncbi:hypothetical protein L211DRAFT_850856 [Terfezia boudieri ATCC MYA-4762]|uniref:Uncharacterized protein n=1 Tax=Terfezia boudieri ATCC MYA-4762 TaxID=1051890 RepID=A0A3N4LL31_9PEZI|nr:hypothetical protein L211DRAFT_850856 [Terfezia boudieri ATCC MYA-4762]
MIEKTDQLWAWDTPQLRMPLPLHAAPDSVPLGGYCIISLDRGLAGLVIRLVEKHMCMSHETNVTCKKTTRTGTGPSPPHSGSPGLPPPCHETTSASQSTKSKRRAIGIHIKSFFESTRPTLWTLANFTSYCHSFSGSDDAYVWTSDKVYSFYIDHLNELLLGRSPLATEAKIKQLLQRAQPRRNTRLRKGGREKEKPQAGAQDSSRWVWCG